MAIATIEPLFRRMRDITADYEVLASIDPRTPLGFKLMQRYIAGESAYAIAAEWLRATK